jgi:hypothetical protein
MEKGGKKESMRRGIVDEKMRRQGNEDEILRKQVTENVTVIVTYVTI